MGSYYSIQTGYAPGGFHRSHPDRNLDVAINVLDPRDIRVVINTGGPQHLNELETRELATRLLIALDEDQDIIDRLRARQEQAGATREQHW